MCLLAVLALVAAFYLASYRGILFEPGYVYQNWDQNIPPYPSEIRAFGDISRHAWSGMYELGSPGIFTGINRAFDILMRDSLAWLGGRQLAHWYFLFYALVGAAGYWRLCRGLGLAFWPALAACLLSQFNPRTYTLAVSGHGFETGFALMLVPWMVHFAQSAMRSTGAAFLANALAAGLAAGLAFSASPLGVVMGGSFLVVWAVAQACSARSWKTLKVLAVAGAVIVSVQLHWVLPAAVTGGEGAKYNQRLEDVRAHYLHLYRDFSVPLRLAMIGTTDNLGMGTEQAYPVEGDFGRWWKVSAFALLGLALLGLTARARNPALKAFAALSLLAGFWMLAGVNTIPGRILYEGVLGRVQVVFFLMARPMRWLPLYQAGLALLVGLGLQAVRDRTFWRFYRWPEPAAALLALAAMTIYLAPWWTGGLTRPRNATTQTMALMPQKLPDEERRLVEAIAADPGMYRVTVFPTIAGPTGDVPEPPRGSLTRNFGLLGKDTLVGPTFVGQPFGRFLLSLASRREPCTDAYGRLLGLGAVRRVFFDSKVPYLSYSDFGWMPRTKRGSETLADPGGMLEGFLEAQRDLVPDPDFSFGSILGFANKDFLPRLRAVGKAQLAAGGLPLLASLSETPGNPFANQAYFFGTDLEASGVERLGQTRAGVTLLGDAWPELLLPWLPASCWSPAWVGAEAPPQGWADLKDHWDYSLWFEGSPLDGSALWSRGPARRDLPLSGTGPCRVFLRMLSLPGQWGVRVSLGGRLLADTGGPDPMDRGWRWLDLGVLDLDGASRLTIEAPGRGAVVSGVLSLPKVEFATARQALERDFPASAGTTVALEAESCALPGSLPYAAVQDVPLLGVYPGLSFTSQGLRQDSPNGAAGPDGLDGTGAGTLAAEGEQVATAEFRLDEPREVSGFTLECHPRLFGDPGGLAFVRGEWSEDGLVWLPLFEVPGKTDGKWEDVYGREVKVRVEARTRSIRLRFTLRQAQLNSLGGPPNQPMRLELTPAEPFPGAVFMGQAVLLPGRFSYKAFRPGKYAVHARLLTADGPAWADLGVRSTDPDGLLDLSGGPPGAACDLFILESLPAEGAAGEPQPPNSRGLGEGMEPWRGLGRSPGPPALQATRINPARYEVSGALPQGGLLLFSESYHPRWSAGEISPLKAYGFMNAFVLPKEPAASLEVLFTPERLRKVGDRLSQVGWAVSGGLCLSFAALAWLQSRRKHDSGEGTP
jgi:hypothetical protein